MCRQKSLKTKKRRGLKPKLLQKYAARTDCATSSLLNSGDHFPSVSWHCNGRNLLRRWCRNNGLLRLTAKYAAKLNCFFFIYFRVLVQVRQLATEAAAAKLDLLLFLFLSRISVDWSRLSETWKSQCVGHVNYNNGTAELGKFCKYIFDPVKDFDRNFAGFLRNSDTNRNCGYFLFIITAQDIFVFKL